ncbi:MAG: signal peptidase II [Coriobacteriia bacterium]|nr:signal peptidase II [Coriobacteriia bacterium]
MTRTSLTAVLAAVAALVVVLDQVTKSVVRTALAPPHPPIEVIGSLLRFNYTLNEGAAFGMLPGHKLVFVSVTAVVLVGIAVYMWRWRPTRLLTVVALGFVAGGAIGNAIDRLTAGRVTDFIQVPFDFPVFNIADSAIVVGVSLLIWWLLFGPTPVESDELTDEATLQMPPPDGAAAED